VEGGQDEGLDVRMGAAQRLDGGDAVHLRHAQVHEHDVDAERDGALDALTAVAGLAGHVDVGLALEGGAQPVADDGVVVDDEKADHQGFPCRAGTVALTAVPSPGALSISREPPTPRRRCLMLLSPNPWPEGFWMPAPSSRMSRRTTFPA